MATPHADRARWQPTAFTRVAEESLGTSTGATKVKTDATFGYFKTLGNNEGPKALVSEYVGTALAEWFGLPVAEFALFDLAREDCYPLHGDRRSEPGPAFVSRFRAGETWEGTAAELDRLRNPADLTRLVVFDTWVRNRDRYFPGRQQKYANVYLAETDDGRAELLAIDHTHCFDTGDEFTTRVAHLDRVRDEKTYGLFPAFVPYLRPLVVIECGCVLRSLDTATVEKVLAGVPPGWGLRRDGRTALGEQILRRAQYLADRIEEGWRPTP